MQRQFAHIQFLAFLVGCFGSYLHVYADSDRGMGSESPAPFLKVEYK